MLEPAKSESVDMIVLGARGVGFLESLMGGGSVVHKGRQERRRPGLAGAVAGPARSKRCTTAAEGRRRTD
jgi:hypothetical protein